MIGFDDEAWDAIQVLFDDPQRATLAERLDEMLDLLEKDSGDQRVRRHWLQLPRLWHFTVTGNGETWSVLWEADDKGEPYIGFAGSGIVG